MLKSLYPLQRQFLEALHDSSVRPPVTGHFEIYRNAYRIRLREALEEDFPVALGCLEPAERQDLLERFSNEYSSPYFTLNALGAGWADYVRDRAERSPSARQRAFAELVRFEWDLNETLFRGGEESRRELPLQQDGPPGLIRLATALAVRAYTLPIHRYYEAGTLPPETESDPLPEGDAVHLAHWLFEGEAHYGVIPAASAALLDCLLKSSTLDQACDHLLARSSYVATHSIPERLATDVEQAIQELMRVGVLQFSPLS